MPALSFWSSGVVDGLSSKVQLYRAKHSTKQTKQVYRLPICFAIVAAFPEICNVDIATLSCRPAYEQRQSQVIAACAWLICIHSQRTKVGS